LYALGAATHSREHLAERRCCGIDINGGSGHVGEERVKNHVVLAIEEENLTLGTLEVAAKSFSELYRGKSSSDNNYPDWLHWGTPCWTEISATLPGSTVTS
jgi:hypothetical protein